MATEVTLPALGESVTEGTVTRWLKSVGDAVAVDEPLLEVSTDKVDTEIPSPVAGTLLEIKAEEDETVEVGAVLALIGEEGEGGGDASADDTAEPEAQPQDEEQAEKKAEQEEEIVEETGDLPPGDETPEAEKETEPEPEPEKEPEQPTAASSGGGGGYVGDAARARRVGDRGHRDPLAEAGRRRRRGRRAAARGLDRQGRHRDPLAGRRHPAGDQGRGGRDRRGRCRARGDRLGIRVVGRVARRRRGPQRCRLRGQRRTGRVHGHRAREGSSTGARGEGRTGARAGARARARARARAERRSRCPTKEPEPEPAAEEPEPAPTPAASSTEDGPGYVTPLVRKLAAQHGVDLAKVSGTGVGGRIRKQDVLAAAEAAKAPAPAPGSGSGAAPATAQPAAASSTPSPLRGTTEKVSRLRKIIAERMLESLQTSAQLTQVIEVDVTNIARLRESVKAEFLAREGVKLSYLPFFAKAAVDALKEHPKLNATIDAEAGEITYFDRENIAFAVDTEKGLLTPVVKDAGDLSIAGMAKKIADVAQRTRTNKIGPDELSGGTFTITNLGSVGALFDTPIINKPQVAILGPGAVVKRPVVIDDENLGETIAIRYMVYLALTYDHRLVDGADAGRFLQDVKRRLEAGAFEV